MEQKQYSQEMMQRIQQAREEGARRRAERTGGVEQPKDKTTLEKTASVLDTLFGGGKVGEAIGTKIAELTAPEETKPYVDTTMPNAKEIAGSALQSAVMFTPAGRLSKAIGTGAKALGVGSNVAKTAGVIGAGALEGYGFDVASSLENNERGSDILTPGAGTAFGAGASALFPLAGKAGKFVREAKTSPKNIYRQEIRKVFEEGPQSKSLTAEASRLKGKNIDIWDELSEPGVFNGIKAENGVFDVSEAIAYKRAETDALNKAKSELMPEVDKLVPMVPKQRVIDEMLADIPNTVDSVRNKIKNGILKETQAYPDFLKPSEIDKIRARTLELAVDKNGKLKKFSPYTSMMKGARRTVTDISNNLPANVDPEGVFTRLNDNIRRNISTMDFLDNKIKGSKVKGGKLGRMSGQIFGALAGSSVGPFAAIAGSKLGDTIAKYAIDATLSKTAKMRIIKALTKDLPNQSSVMKEVETFIDDLQKINKMEKLLLPAPAIQAGAKTGTSGISVVPAGKGLVGADAKTGRFIKTYSSTGEDIINRPIKLAKESIENAKAPRPNVASADDALLAEARKYKTAEEFVKAQDMVQRIEEPNVAVNFDKPQGLYTTPSNVKSPHLELGGKKTEFVIKSGFNEVAVDTSGLSKKPMERGVDQMATNLVWLRETLPEVSNDIRGKTISELKNTFSKEYPKINWDKYIELQDMIEGYAGLKAREQGIDIIRGIDKQLPEFSEIVILNKDSVLTKQQLTDIWKKAHGIK